MTYFSSRSVRLIGDEYSKFAGTRVDVMGGLTLMFDVDDHLRSVCYRPVTDEDVRQIRVLVAEMIQAGTIVDQLYISSHGFTSKANCRNLCTVNELLRVLAKEQNTSICGYKLIRYFC